MMKHFFAVVCLLLLLSLSSNLYLYHKLENSQPDSTAQQSQKNTSFKSSNTHTPQAEHETYPLFGPESETNKLTKGRKNQPTIQGRIQSRQDRLLQAQHWLQQEDYFSLNEFLRDYLKQHPQDIDFLLIEADLIAQTGLLSEAIIHYYSLLELTMSQDQYQQVQDIISSLSGNTISQLEKAYSWEILAIFVEPLLQIDPDNRLYILALATAYAEQQLANLMENTLASLPFDDAQALAIRGIIQVFETAQKSQQFEDDAQPTEASLGRSIKLKQFADQYVASAQLSGNNIDLLIDTGASITAISRNYYRQLSNRFKVNYIGRFQVNTANGSVMAPVLQFRDLQIGSYKVENISVVVLPMGALEHADGLLGMNFLREFDFRIDQRKALLYLK